MTQRFGPYLLSERIGSGGMGEIFRARLVREQGFEKELVIKRILPHLSRNPEFVALFNNEAKIAARLDHPNICQIFDFGQHEGIYYIAMEYIRGHDLRSLLDRVERVPPAQAIQIACGCLRALDYAFTRRKVVHRDVSPQNIMLAYSGAVKLMDFGLAKAIHRESVASAGSIKGNFGYMSPEQVRSGDLDVRSDLFNLGAVLYEMLCGATLYDPKQPFARLIEQIAEARFEPLAARDPTIDPRIVAVVERALARDRGSRYANAAEMRASLDEVASACRLDVGSLPLASFLELTMGPAPLERRQTDTMPAVTEVAGGRDSVRALVGEPALASPRTDIAREPAARISPTLELRRPNGTADQPVAEGQTRVAVEPATATAATPHAAARPWIWGLSFVAIVAIAIAAALGWPGKPPQPLESFSSALSDGPMIHELQRRAGLPAVRPKLPIPSPPIPKRVLRYGRLLVTVDPTTARVLVDEVLLQGPPYAVRLSAGRHTLRLEQAGYRSESIPIAITADETLNVRQALRKLPPARVACRVVSTPPGATLRLAERVVNGVTPLTLDLLAGRHPLRLDLEGYQPLRAALDVSAGKPCSFSVTLRPLRYELHIGPKTLRESAPKSGVLRWSQGGYTIQLSYRLTSKLLIFGVRSVPYATLVAGSFRRDTPVADLRVPLPGRRRISLVRRDRLPVRFGISVRALVDRETMPKAPRKGGKER